MLYHDHNPINITAKNISLEFFDCRWGHMGTRITFSIQFDLVDSEKTTFNYKTINTQHRDKNE